MSNLFLLAASAFLAVCLMPLLKIDLLSAYLAATPGGLDSVAAMATDLKADAALILAVHSLRLISVVTIGPYLVQFMAQRLAAPKACPEHLNRKSAHKERIEEFCQKILGL